MSRPARALWIEIFLALSGQILILVSRPARALWIEILFFDIDLLSAVVEAREGLVD